MKCCEARASLRALYTKPIAAVIPARSANGFVFSAVIVVAHALAFQERSRAAVYLAPVCNLWNGIGSTIGKILIIRPEAILGRSSLILLSQAIGF